MHLRKMIPLEKVLCVFLAIITCIVLSHKVLATANNSSVLDVAVAGERFFVVTSTGDLVAWGDNYNKTITSDESPEVLYSEREIMLSDAIHVCSSDFCTLAIDKNNVLYGWGNNPFGQLLENQGYGALMENIVSAAAGARHCIAVTSDGTLLVWGSNDCGQLGLGYTSDSVTQPQKLLEGMKLAYAFGDISFAISGSGDLYTWGGPFAKPTMLISNVASVAFMRSSSYQVLLNDGQIVEYESETDIQNYEPVFEPIACDVRTILNMGYIDTNGALWGWSDGIDSIAPAEVVATDVVIAEASPPSYLLYADQEGVLYLRNRLTGNEITYSVNELTAAEPEASDSVVGYTLVLLSISVFLVIFLTLVKRRKI